MGDGSTESKLVVVVDDVHGEVGLAPHQQHRQRKEQTSEVVSQLYFCHNRNGSGDHFNLAHIRKTTTMRGGSRSFLKKDLYSWGILSPSEVVSNGNSASAVTPHFKFEQPNPILMMCDSISFPFAVAPTSCKDFTIQWKESNIPTTYFSLYGSIRTAAIGRKYGRSIAIAASRGLCIFDLSSRNQEEENASRVLSNLGPSIIPTPCIAGSRCNDDGSGGVKSNTAKWRMFRELDERALSVRAMTWWERCSMEGDVSEDLLLAVIEYHLDGEVPSWNGSNRNDAEGDDDGETTTQCYLVCWSRRRLGQGSLQLLQEPSSSRFEDDTRRMGIPLPKGFIPASISLVVEPRQESGVDDDDVAADRAVLLLGSEQRQSNHSNGYLTYQIQTASASKEGRQRQQTVMEENAEGGGNPIVLANFCSSGFIDDTFLRRFSSRSNISPCGIFIAGASFQFDLVNDGNYGSHTTQYIATLGVICAMGKTMFTVIVTPIGPVSCACLYESDFSKIIYSTVQRYWIGDTVMVKSKDRRGQFVWTVAKSDGCNFTWSVPFFQYQRDHDDDSVVVTSAEEDMTGLKDDVNKNMKVKSILLDVLLPHAKIISSHLQSAHTQNSDLHGTVFHDGDVLHGCVIDESEILLGPMPSIYCQFVFYVGQASCNILRTQLDSSIVQLYGLTDCIVGPPTFVSSLFIDLSEDDAVRHLHSTHIFEKFKYFDTTMVAVRTIVTCLTVFISSTMDKSDEITVGNSEVNNVIKIVEDALSRILTFARGSMSDIHFASLFLSTGRQLEPHQCNHLFPLLFSAHTPSKSLITDLEDNIKNVPLSISVQDLYSSAVTAGSLTVAASALPLLDVKKFTHKQCMLLLHHSISTILRLSTVNGKQCISCIREECVFFRQLYLYGLKLEDSANMLEYEEDSSCSDEGSSTSDDSNLSEDDSIHSENSYDTSSYSQSFPINQDDECSPTQKTSGSPSRVLQFASTLFSPIKILNKMKEEKKSEIAISEAASSFIFSGYCDDIYKIEGNPCVSSESYNTCESTLLKEVSHLHFDVCVDVYDSETRPSRTFEGNSIGIAETIGFAIVSSMFYPSAIESSSSRLNKVAMLCLLLQNESDEQSTTNVDTDPLNSIKKVTEDSFQNSVESICHMELCHDIRYLNKGCALSSVKSLITSLMLLCVDQWDYDLSSTVLQTIISLLTRDSSGRLSKITPLLAMIALSAGHTCQKVETLFGSNSGGTSPLEKLYRQCVEEL